MDKTTLSIKIMEFIVKFFLYLNYGYIVKVYTNTNICIGYCKFEGPIPYYIPNVYDIPYINTYPYI